MGNFPFDDTDEVSFGGPSLFVRGTRSHYVPDGILPTIRRFFPNFELQDIDCGHWVISEQPELFRKGEDFTVLSMGDVSVLTHSVVVDFMSDHQASETR